jgi:SAM-dependent methyltransferase
VRILFTVTLFLSSALLFLVQPMIAKMILPRFGGSPGVWNTSMLFFQAALLLGYGYAHLATKYLGPRVQAAIHMAVLLLPLLFMPFALPSGIETGSGNPAPLVLLILSISVGVPFLVNSAGAPLLQRWFAATDDPHAHDPYFLYSGSNLGSMLALLAYPLVVEPRLRLTEQARVWMYGYIGMAVLMAACAAATWLRRGSDPKLHESPATMPADYGEGEPGSVEVDWKQRALWIALAFCPSSLMLGVTTYLTSNIAPVPLLWVIPLALYLLTFIMAFAKKQLISSRILGRVLPLLVVPLALIIVLEASDPRILIPLVIFHLLVFFVVSLMCHTELTQHRPKASHLTEFYFFVSVGGVLGGVFNALLAPALFNSFLEYPLVLAFACAFRPRPSELKPNRMDWIYPVSFAVAAAALVALGKAVTPEPGPIRTAITIGVPLILVFITADRPVRFAASLFALFVVLPLMQVAVAGKIVASKRSFFGVHRVEEYRNRFGLFRSLSHGNTEHGKENFGELAGTPLTYYYPSGPIGGIFRSIAPAKRDVALVGLGIGSLAAYGRPGQNFTYYEIDPDVVAIAKDPKLFTFLGTTKANLKVTVGDARIELAKASDASYGLIVLDAFSSDSIPIHLLTREAIAMYLRKLKPGGVLAFHISNRYLDLAPLLGNEAQSLGLVAWINEDMDVEAEKGKFASTWVAMARSASDFDGLRRVDPAWIPLQGNPALPVWTDDYSNIVSLLKLGRRDED